jgi:Predicted transcriptional regulator
MKINLMTDYAVRVICCIYESEKRIVTSNNISKKKEIPHGVLMKVLRELREKKIVVSHQGRGEVTGGYTLGEVAKEITMLDIVETMEGDIVLENIRKKEIKTIEDIEADAILREYRRVSQILRKEMQKKTIYEILKDNKQK